MIAVKQLSKTFTAKKKGGSGSSLQTVRAVDALDLTWEKDQFIAVVGESGCGKSTLGRMLAGLIPPSQGSIELDNVPMSQVLSQRGRPWSRVVQLIPQDPYAAINPVRKIRSLFRDPLLYHHRVAKSQVDLRIEELLAMVGLDPKNVLDKYPHQLSGGQRQRVVVARAMTVDPGYLVADEAVSMVDVSLRIGIMDHLKKISTERQLGLLFITHDFRVARYIAQNGTIAVMYLGRVVEQGPSEEILGHPMHPYTQALLSAVPILEGREERVNDVVPLRYEVSAHGERGCAFASRCPFADQTCRETSPPLTIVQAPDHSVACHYAESRSVVIDRSQIS